MILERTLAAVFGANCYVLAAGPERPALVVDPGAGAARGALALMRSHRLTLGGVLLTHGHADHVWDAQRLIDAAHGEGLLASQDAVTVPVYVPEPDRYRLEDPDQTTGIRAGGMTFAQMAGSDWEAPVDLRVVPPSAFTQAWEVVPGVALQAVAAPGHSEGSSLFFLNALLGDNDLLYEAEVLDDPSTVEEKRYLMALSGDVIFKGSVGRTDLPGGDQVQMWATLRFLAQAVDPATVLLPGHGAVTTMEHEHRGNPYLAEAKVRGGDRRA
nr:MBL fold metallo-hydrolase [Actinomyces sp.]